MKNLSQNIQEMWDIMKKIKSKNNRNKRKEIYPCKKPLKSATGQNCPFSILTQYSTLRLNQRNNNNNNKKKIKGTQTGK